MIPEIKYATVNNAKYEETGSISASINGDTYSGITDQSGYWSDIQNYINEGGAIEEYVEPIITTEQQLAQTDGELVSLINKLARPLEDLMQAKIDAGEYVNQRIKDKIEERINLRSQIN